MEPGGDDEGSELVGLDLMPVGEPLEMFRRLLADTAVELESATYAEEWWLSSRGRLPVFDVEWLGAKAYLRAGESGLAGDFRRARQLLNRLTATRLFPIGERWFEGVAPG